MTHITGRVTGCFSPKAITPQELLAHRRAGAADAMVAQVAAGAATKSHGFVGRKKQLHSVAAWLRGKHPAPLYVQGPGGIGKTELLSQAAGRAAARGIRIAWIEGHGISAGALPDAVGRALGLKPGADWLETIGSQRTLLVIDTLEAVSGSIGSLGAHLAALPPTVAVLLAGRGRMAVEHSVLTGLRRLRTLTLPAFDRAESDQLLRQRGVAPQRHAAIYSLTGGHPLALVLVAQLDPRALPEERPLQSTPALFESLVERFLRDVPSEAHRLALRVSCIVLWTTEDLLKLWFDAETAAQLFAWLASLSWVEIGVHGLLVHETMREAFVADLKWRDEPLYRSIVARAREHFLGRLEHACVAGRDRSSRELFHLASQAALWSGGSVPAEDMAAGSLSPVRPSDWPQMEAIVRRHEGDASAQLLRFWKGRESAVLVIRDPAGRISAFAVELPLERIAPEDAARDPGVKAVYEYVHQVGISGHRASYVRFWMEAEQHQPISLFSPVTAAIADRFVRTPDVAFGFIAVADPTAWLPTAESTNSQYFPDADFEVGGQKFGVFAIDVRGQSTSDWMREHMARMSGEPMAPQPPIPGRDDFLRNVGGALRHLHEPRLLQRNPLVSSKLVSERVGEQAAVAERAEALAELLRESCSALRQGPKGKDHYRVIERTYLRPAVKQQAAAIELGIPFSTFRRYLAAAEHRLADALWEREVGAVAPVKQH